MCTFTFYVTFVNDILYSFSMAIHEFECLSISVQSVRINLPERAYVVVKSDKYLLCRATFQRWAWRCQCGCFRIAFRVGCPVPPSPLPCPRLLLPLSEKKSALRGGSTHETGNISTSFPHKANINFQGPNLVNGLPKYLKSVF